MDESMNPPMNAPMDTLRRSERLSRSARIAEAAALRRALETGSAGFGGRKATRHLLAAIQMMNDQDDRLAGITADMARRMPDADLDFIQDQARSYHRHMERCAHVDFRAFMGVSAMHDIADTLEGWAQDPTMPARQTGFLLAIADLMRAAAKETPDNWVPRPDADLEIETFLESLWDGDGLGSDQAA